MLTIWKYGLSITDWQDLEMPKGACLLDVQMQNGIPCLWALVNDDVAAEQELRKIWIVGMNHDATHVKDREYIGTVLVWHVFAECGGGHAV